PARPGSSPDKARPSRCPPTATPPSSAGLATTRKPAPCGCLPAAAGGGGRRGTSWWGPAPAGAPGRAVSARPWPEGNPPTWAGAGSADGNTAIVGGSADNAATGAAWVFTRSGGIWTQQGDKLVGTGGVGIGGQGRSVALSADGNTAIVGGSFDNGLVGAAWVY